MITEDYVSFETAKLLKEKGFDLSEFCGKWAIDYDKIPQHVDNPNGEIIVAEWQYPLITLQMAMKWLRRKHGLHCSVDNDYVHGWYCQITSLYEIEEYGDYEEMKHYHPDKDHGFLLPEEACEAAIKYCLENLI